MNPHLFFCFFAILLALTHPEVGCANVFIAAFNSGRWLPEYILLHSIDAVMTEQEKDHCGSWRTGASQCPKCQTCAKSLCCLLPWSIISTCILKKGISDQYLSCSVEFSFHPWLVVIVVRPIVWRASSHLQPCENQTADEVHVGFFLLLSVQIELDCGGQ